MRIKWPALYVDDQEKALQCPHGQARLYEHFSLFIRNFLPKYPQPDAGAIEDLKMAVIV